MKTFDIELENLGPIKSGKFETAHLNIICGPNNSGKSFFLHSIYVFLRNGFSQYFSIPVDQQWVEDARSNGVVQVPLQPFQEKINSYLDTGIPAFIKSLPKALAKQQDLFNNFHVHIKINPEYVAAMNSNDFSLQFQITEKCKCEVQKTKGNLKLIFINSKGDFPAESLIKPAIESVVKFALMHFVFAVPVFLITSERTGSAMFVDSISLPSERKRQEENLPLQPTGGMEFPLPHQEELRFVSSRNLRVISKRDSDFNKEPRYALVRKLLNDIVSGTFSFDDAKGVRFVPEDTSLDLDMSEVSSSIRALMPLDFIVRHCLDENSILLFDEPELNLTPENQRRLARLLVQLTKTGVGVFITTHSDYIVREINTLVAFNRQTTHSKRIANNHSYSEEEFIAPSNVSLHYIKKTDMANENAFIAIPLTGDGHTVIPPFDDSIDDMVDIQTQLGEEEDT